MPLALRGRLASQAYTGPHTALEQYLAFYRPAGTPGFHSAVVAASAQEQERLGYDSTLYPQRATGPAVWPVVGWALSATQRLAVVAAHRVGVELPSVAARALATLDRLSNGRAAVHVLQGRDDLDVQRDGMFLAKPQRYALAEEYLDVFTRTLESDQPFDYHGQFYQLENAQADIQPAQRPRPTISIPGTSDHGVTLAARYADVYSVPIATEQTASRAITRIRLQADQLGRTRPLGYWADANIILGTTDAQAWAWAHQIADTLQAEKASTPAYDHGNAQAALQQWGAHEHSGAWYPRLNQLTGHGYTLVGSVDSLARHLLDFYQLGIETITLGGIANRFDAQGRSCSDPEQLALLKALIDALHHGALLIDAQRGVARAAY
ncbi:LLM class flavin-dependent oxidoreductase [Pseudomonas sp. NPDC007930]|uniref:LLM class flavin-dependent oxidoreductase n=1 Tax=Pseudomonas sp. NPDC007930 TaxID=3364417 RepID=UPI0036E44A4B